MPFAEHIETVTSLQYVLRRTVIQCRNEHTADSAPDALATNPTLSVQTNFSFAAKCLLALLLLTDAAFILAHLIHTFTPFLNPAGYSIEQERGYSEIFQYIKYFWIILLLGTLAVTRREWNFGLWMLLYLYLLGDDASQYHERGGEFLTATMGYQAQWGLRAQDFGELSMSLIVLTLFSLFGIKAYLGANAEVRRAIKGYGLLLALLAFFGVCVDMLHVVAGGDSFPLLGVVEDGGEMLTVSLTCWYTFHLLENRGKLPVEVWRNLPQAIMPGMASKNLVSNP